MLLDCVEQGGYNKEYGLLEGGFACIPNIIQPKVIMLLAAVETALQLIFDIFEWPQKASKLWVKIPQNILVQIGLKWLHINTFS